MSPKTKRCNWLLSQKTAVPTDPTPRRVKARKMPDSAFKPNHCAESNRVFLWEAGGKPPFMHAVSGWRIVGWGNAPWPKPDLSIAVLFERVEPKSSTYGNVRGDEMEEGTRIWQHGKPEWVPGHPNFKGDDR